MPIAFYIPPALWPEDLPGRPDENWAGYGLGLYAWTVQTYLKLRETGIACELTSQLPAEGIVLFHANALRSGTILPGPMRLLICLKAESSLCAQAQLHIVQNPCEVTSGCYFIPHWPQPGLQPRAQKREQFETVAFLGHRNSLAPELMTQMWKEQLQQRGLRWQPVINTNRWDSQQSIDTRWNDYRQIDAIVAVRRFEVRRPRYRSKPATKLYNAWLAGVPAILGRELAYQATGRPGIHYLEANSIEDVLCGLERLKQDNVFRQRLVKKGQLQAIQYTPEAITQRWQNFLNNVAIPAYGRWCRFPRWRHRVYHWQAKLLSYGDRIQRRLDPF